MPRIIDHNRYSDVTSNLINSATNKISGGSQCYAIACLSALWMCRGSEGREKLWKYCHILNQIEELSLKNYRVNYISLLEEFCINESPVQSEYVNNIKKLDPDLSIIRNLPILSVIHYLYFDPEMMPDFPLIASYPPLDDQDFIAVHQILSSIEKDGDKLKQLENIFPGYKTIKGQSFEQDYKRIQSEWRCENDNDATGKFSNITLNKQGLNKFCQWIKSMMENDSAEIEHKNIQLILSVAHHAVTLQYDANTHKWYIADSLNLEEINLKTGLDDDEMLERLLCYLTYDSSVSEDERYVRFSSEIIFDRRLNLRNINLDEFKKFSGMSHVTLSNGKHTFYFASLYELNKLSRRFGKYASELRTKVLSDKSIINLVSITADDFYSFISECRSEAKILIDTLLTSPESYQKYIRTVADAVKIFKCYPEFILQNSATVERLSKYMSDSSNYPNAIQSVHDGRQLIQIFPEHKNKIMDYMIKVFPGILFNSIDDLVILIKQFPEYEKQFVELLMPPWKFETIIDSYYSLVCLVSSIPSYTSQLIDYVISRQIFFDRIFLSGNTNRSIESIENIAKYEALIVNALLSSRQAIEWLSSNDLFLITFIKTIPSCDKQLMNFVMLSQENFHLIFRTSHHFARFIATYPAYGAQLVEHVLSTKLCFDEIFASGAALGYFILRCPVYKTQLMDYILSDLDRLDLILSNGCDLSGLSLIFAALNNLSEDRFLNVIKKIASFNGKIYIQDVTVSLNHLQLQRKILACSIFNLSFSSVSSPVPTSDTLFLGEMNNINKQGMDIDDWELQKLLNHIAKGEQDQAEIMIKHNSALLFKNGTVKDYSGRELNILRHFNYHYGIWINICGICF